MIARIGDCDTPTRKHMIDLAAVQKLIDPLFPGQIGVQIAEALPIRGLQQHPTGGSPVPHTCILPTFIP